MDSYLFEEEEEEGYYINTDPTTLNYEQAIKKACDAFRNNKKFTIYHRKMPILYNFTTCDEATGADDVCGLPLWQIPAGASLSATRNYTPTNNVVVFVIGPNSFKRMDSELPTCGMYNAIYAITGKKAIELGIKSIESHEYPFHPDLIDNLSKQLIKTDKLPFHSYSELLAGKIIKEKVAPKIFNIYFEGPQKFKDLGDKIGMKRFATQLLYTEDYLQKQDVDYCCIDDSTCLLSSLNLDSNRKDGQRKVEANDKITWMEGINQFLINKESFSQKNFFYGFGKLSDNQNLPVRKSRDYQHLVATNAIYKMFFSDYQCMTTTLYDPYCASMKEDVDWLIRKFDEGGTLFRKNNAISCCKFNTNLCSPGEPKAQTKEVSIADTDLHYYHNLFNRMIMLSQKKIYYYLVPLNFETPNIYSLLIGFGNNKRFDKLGMSEKAIEGATKDYQDPKPKYIVKQELEKINEEMVKFYEKLVDRIFIFNVQAVDKKQKVRPIKCAFASYAKATFKIMEDYGFQLFGTFQMPNKSSAMKRGREREISFTNLQEIFDTIIHLENEVLPFIN